MRSTPCWVLAVAGAALTVTAHSASRTIQDSAGRSVSVPTNIERVYAAGPPASIFLYTLAPNKLAGWNQPLHDRERAFIPARYHDLPVLGRLTGRGNTANTEVVLKAGAQVIIDYGAVKAVYRSLADRVQAQTGIPYLLIDGRFRNIPAAYRKLGALINESQRAEQLATYAERLFAKVNQILQSIPQEQRPRVYYGRGPDGLHTGVSGAINVELLDVVGATNVAATHSDHRGLASVSMEQILQWNPQVVLTLDKRFYRSVFKDPTWHSIDAVKNKRVYLAPRAPFGWFDRPPSVNRLIGVQWLLEVLYPQQTNIDLRAVTKDFYRQFYHVDLSNKQLDELLEPAL